MTIAGGVGANAPTLPGSENPAFRTNEIVTDITRTELGVPANIRVRIVSVIRHETIHIACPMFHRGAHTKNCERRGEVWYQYCVTEEVHKGLHDNGRQYRHVHERNLQFLAGVTK